MIYNKLKNKIPPPVIFLICCVISWQVSYLSPKIELNTFIIHSVSLLLLIIGISIPVTAVFLFLRSKTTLNPHKPEATSSLVTTGVYKFSRNPMYLGLAICQLSLSVYLASPISIIGLVCFVLYINHFQIKPEEQRLINIFGDKFLDYQSKVRRWI